MRTQKKVILVLKLVEESLEIDNSEIKNEIIQKLANDLPVIPWFENIKELL